MSEDHPTTLELELVEAARAGDEAAAAEIRSPERTNLLAGVLRNRGATDTEARDLVADLWADCFDERDGKRPLLDKFSGKGPLEGFLVRTALNRLIDLKRRQKFRGSLPASASIDSPGDAFDRLPGEAESRSEDALVDLLRQALLNALAKCDPEQLLIMKLVSIHRIDQQTVGQMWGWSQSKISRSLGALMETLRTETLSEVRRIDPWLELEWTDFVELCRSSRDFFADILENTGNPA